MVFHAKLGPFPGGFLGVDVFFVISGYLITRIVLPDIAGGRFSLRIFYMRRVRRILPALYLVTLLCLPVGLYLLISEDLTDLAKSAIAAVLFVPNFYFWDTADYFARAADFKPLIHTWSLGVEEQFYLLFPALLLLLAARARVAVLTLITPSPLRCRSPSSRMMPMRCSICCRSGRGSWRLARWPPFWTHGLWHGWAVVPSARRVAFSAFC